MTTNELTLCDEEGTIIANFYLYHKGKEPTQDFLNEKMCYELGHSSQARDLFQQLEREIKISENQKTD